jgi:DNA-binding winged helix-turn-helix (wHTH) protein
MSFFSSRKRRSNQVRPAMIYRFGDFELNSSSFELRKANHPVSIEPKALEVLLHLVNCRDRLVPKEELLDTVWHNVIVGESVLTRGA